MLEELAKTAIQQVPALAVLVFLVLYFLKHLQNRDKSWGEVVSRNTEAMNKNTHTLGEACETMRTSAKAMDKLADSFRPGESNNPIQ